MPGAFEGAPPGALWPDTPAIGDAGRWPSQYPAAAATAATTTATMPSAALFMGNEPESSE
jgi:hypothetical protein